MMPSLTQFSATPGSGSADLQVLSQYLRQQQAMNPDEMPDEQLPQFANGPGRGPTSPQDPPKKSMLSSL